MHKGRYATLIEAIPMGTNEVMIAPVEPVRLGLESLAPVIAAAGEKAGRRFVQFFTANIRNKNTRLAYARAAGQFLAWCERRGLGLLDLEPTAVATYGSGSSKCTPLRQ